MPNPRKKAAAPEAPVMLEVGDNVIRSPNRRLDPGPLLARKPGQTSRFNSNAA
jgi:hypothetical protein